ncbi:MAG: hypothetical protein GF410_09785 [Chitinivibrionales bacterium]|nr:hypothetical protein [Chitinivibrionales bacterium]
MHTAGAVILFPPRVSQDSMTVGDRIDFRVSMVVPPDAQVTPPPAESGFGEFVVKDWSMDRQERKSSDSLTFKYVLTLYTAEHCTIPALPYILGGPDSLGDTLMSEPLPVRVVSLVTSDSADIRDLKPQQRAGRPSLWWLWSLLALAALAGAAALGRHLLRKARKTPPPPPPKPPFDEAMEALARLEARQYLAKGMIREYVFELSEILKRYIERRFGTNASEYTTEEMLAWLDRAPLDAKSRRWLEWFFTEADPVKFAKHVPSRDIMERFGPEARSFVEQTRPVQQKSDTSVSTSREGNNAVQGS